MKLKIIEESERPHLFGSAIGLFYLCEDLAEPELWMTAGADPAFSATQHICLNGKRKGMIVKAEDSVMKGILVDVEATVIK